MVARDAGGVGVADGEGVKPKRHRRERRGVALVVSIFGDRQQVGHRPLGFGYGRNLVINGLGRGHGVCHLSP
jgi:hypothetical protein